MSENKENLAASLDFAYSESLISAFTREEDLVNPQNNGLKISWSSKKLMTDSAIRREEIMSIVDSTMSFYNSELTALRQKQHEIEQSLKRIQGI